jgi:hypothetical protein
MLIISHRGNLNGPNPDTENDPEHIQKVLKKYNCEIDVWFNKGKFFLGHDYPQYEVETKFLLQDGLFCHAKNLNALEEMLEYKVKSCFYHENDNHTLTSDNLIWTYPGRNTGKKSIIVDTSKDWKLKEYKCFGVCVDYV